VSKGQIIGQMGNTYGSSGYASGVHLHFGVQHHGIYIDPQPLLEK
jgi:murein DD-endopeptidase MepM/ murein hydrolase activator NlpD